MNNGAGKRARKTEIILYLFNLACHTLNPQQASGMNSFGLKKIPKTLNREMRKHQRENPSTTKNKNETAATINNLPNGTKSWAQHPATFSGKPNSAPKPYFFAGIRPRSCRIKKPIRRTATTMADSISCLPHSDRREGSQRGKTRFIPITLLPAARPQAPPSSGRTGRRAPEPPPPRGRRR